MRRLTLAALGLVVAFTLAVLWRTVTDPVSGGAVSVAGTAVRGYLVAGDVPYRRVGDWTGRADIFASAGPGPFPVVLFLHGGGWVSGSKGDARPWTLPFLMAGYAVVAVNYRLASVARAPAAVDDARCARAWVDAHAAEYRLDATRVVVAGESAGGHLALMTALLEGREGLPSGCVAGTTRTRAVINFYGITDVVDLLRRQLQQKPDWPFVIEWVGSKANQFALAAQTSPVNWIDGSVPPVFSVHGTADTLVPYGQAVALHAALNKAGVRNELLTLPGGGHGDLSIVNLVTVVRRMLAFLKA